MLELSRQRAALVVDDDAAPERTESEAKEGE
jgi:hypothetical protein